MGLVEELYRKSEIRVRFYDTIDDQLLKFAVIAARYQRKWVFCKHKQRTTYECPGGHREGGENIYDNAKRELYEETGAVDVTIKPVCVYSVITTDNMGSVNETYGMLYYAEVLSFGSMPDSEIEMTVLLDRLPDNWTYPEIQPRLMERVYGSLYQ